MLEHLRRAWRGAAARVRASLIPNWREAWRFGSVQLLAAGALLCSVLIASPDVVAITLSILPEGISSRVPPFAVLGWSLAVIAARVLKLGKRNDQ